MVFMWVYVFIFFWGECPRVKLLDHEIVACLVLQEESKHFPEWLHHFLSPLVIGDWSSFSPALPALGVVVISYFNHSDTCVMIYCGLNLHSFTGKWSEAIRVFIWHLNVPFSKCLFMIFPHFVTVLVLLFLLLKFESCLCLLDTSSLWYMSFMVPIILSQSVPCFCFCFYPPIRVFLKPKVLNSVEAELVKYSSYESWFWYESKSSLLRLHHKDILFFRNIL